MAKFSGGNLLQHRNQIGHLWLGLLLLTALLATAWPAAVAAQGTTIGIDPLQASGDPDQDLSVQVVIEDVETLGFFQFDLTFDPAVVRVKTVALGEYLGSTGRDTTGVGPLIDNDQGKLTFGAFSVGDQAGPSGDGVLAVVTLTGVADGISPLDLANIKVLSASNTVIATFVSSRATVTIGEMATPTPTTTATVGAGTLVPTVPGSAPPAPGTTVPSPAATPGTTPASQATATATARPVGDTPTPGPATATSAATATPAAQLAATAEPAVTTTATAADATPPPASQATAEPTVVAATLPAGATETPTAEAAQPETTPTVSEPDPTPAATEVAAASLPAGGSGERAPAPAAAPRWLLGVGVGALVLAGIIAVVIAVLVFARRKGS